MCRLCGEPTFLPRSTTVEGFAFSQAAQRRYHLKLTWDLHASPLINSFIRHQWFYLMILLTLYICGKNRLIRANLWRQAIDRCNWQSRDPKLKQKTLQINWSSVIIPHSACTCVNRNLPITKQQYLVSRDLALPLETKTEIRSPYVVNSLARLTGCCMIECARADSEMSSSLRGTPLPPIFTEEMTVILVK
jgi:hypothetical protein